MRQDQRPLPLQVSAEARDAIVMQARGADEAPMGRIPQLQEAVMAQGQDLAGIGQVLAITQCDVVRIDGTDRLAFRQGP